MSPKSLQMSAEPEHIRSEEHQKSSTHRYKNRVKKGLNFLDNLE